MNRYKNNIGLDLKFSNTLKQNFNKFYKDTNNN